MTTTFEPTAIQGRHAWLRWLAPALMASAIALGAMALDAPTANADKLSENTIKSECKDANGGTYTTTLKGRTRFSTCSYSDNEGNSSTDYYVNGQYYSTRPGRPA
ncbi:hypothetical protein JDV09_15880 [Mycobacterium sp. Y57]|uniref:hypothetical protein n=1 Tax=Mycolicibacterium xanthum TaxID=2796469 RepID=UPI001C863532|nr:hypothetical protein [Mycolicibacterium xanthum]MBX7433578.1 hypothetical protein [Mycolicibacterium xanthum]